MELLDILTKLWPIFIALIALVVVLAKAENRISVLEDKVKTLFDLIVRKR
jgi:hypothetical protein